MCRFDFCSSMKMDNHSFLKEINLDSVADVALIG